jgi:hypothetical protein
VTSIHSFVSWTRPRLYPPRVRMEVPYVAPPPVAQLNDEQAAAEVEQALAARRNHRFSLALLNKGNRKRSEEEDSSSDHDDERGQPQEPIVPVRIEGPVLALADSSSDMKQALYRFMYLFENQRGCVVDTSTVAYILTLKTGGHGLDFGSRTRR